MHLPWRVKIAPLTLACPIDRLPLIIDGPTAKCANGHSFDRAREGYLNLLTSQHKSSSQPGDLKTMLDSRHRVLERGTYAPLAQRLFTLVSDTHPGAAPLRVVDAGCGEGYYLRYLAEQASTSPRDGNWELAGMDISKWGVRLAARSFPEISWAVANNRHPPFPGASIDLILCMFGFPMWNAFRELQAPDGHILMVDPAPDHLIELRSLIYPEVRRRDPPSLNEAMARGYLLVHEEELHFRVRLASQDQIADLLAMTPHMFRVPFEKRPALKALSELDLTAHVALRMLRLKP